MPTSSTTNRMTCKECGHPLAGDYGFCSNKCKLEDRNRQIVEMAKTMSHVEIALHFGITRSAVTHVCKGLTALPAEHDWVLIKGDWPVLPATFDGTNVEETAKAGYWPEDALFRHGDKLFKVKWDNGRQKLVGA